MKRFVSYVAPAALLSLVLASCLALPAVASAADDPPSGQYYVDPVHGNDASSGLDTASAFKTITRAISRAGYNSTVTVLPGVCSTQTGESFPLRPDLKLLRLVSRDGAARTTIRGDGTESVVRYETPYAGAMLRGFTITGGDAEWGGGVCVEWLFGVGYPPGYPVIVDNRIVDNRANTGGGGIWIRGADPYEDQDRIARPRLLHNVISGNSCAGDGGGVALGSNAGVDMLYNDVRDNSAVNGGGLACESTPGTNTAYLESNRFWSNSAEGMGGGLYLPGLKSLVTDHNRILDNEATFFGGVLAGPAPLGIEMYADVVSGNYSSQGPGGIAVWGSGVSMTNLEVVENVTRGVSGEVGGIEMTDCYARLSGCTIAGNQAPPGGWDGVRMNGVGDAMVWGCVLWQTHDATLPADAEDLSVSQPSLNYGITRDTDWGGTLISHADPAFANPDSRDYRPAIGSPMIDEWPHSGLSTPFDRRRVPRPLDGDGDGPDGSGAEYSDNGCFEVRSPVTRLPGDRYSLAATAAAAQFPRFQGTHDVVLACGDTRAMADVLTAAGLCWAYDAPLLLTPSASLSTQTRNALLSLKEANTGQDGIPLTIHVVGGTGSVPESRLSDIRAALGTDGVVMERLLSTGNRYDLARAIAKRMTEVRGDEMGRTALIANGADPAKFADALALSAISRGSGAPVLLVAYGSVPLATSRSLTENGLTTRFVAGGTATVSSAVVNQLNAVRWSGADRYATAAAIASRANGSYLAHWGTIGVASGSDMYSALIGATVVGRDRGVLYLSKPTSLPSVTVGALTAHKARNAECYVFGSTASLSEGVRSTIRTRLY